MNQRRQTGRPGFTLVETIVALAIGLMLLAIVLGIFARAFSRDRHVSDRVQGIHAVTFLAGAIEGDVQRATRAQIDDEDLVLTLPAVYDPLHPARKEGGQVRLSLAADGSIRRTLEMGDGKPGRAERVGTGRYASLRFSATPGGDAVTVSVAQLPSPGEPAMQRTFTLRLPLAVAESYWPENAPLAAAPALAD